MYYNKKRIINNKALENQIILIDKKRFIVPDYNYSIYDINGRLIGNYKIYDNKTSPNISFGNYILKLKSK